MVSSKLIKLGTPFTRSSLLALSTALVVDACFFILAAWHYPYLIGRDEDFYIESVRTISSAFIAVGIFAIGIAISGLMVSYRYNNNFVLVHAGLAAIFLPVLILVLFGSYAARYKIHDHENNYRTMFENYGHKISPGGIDEATKTSECQVRMIRAYNPKWLDYIQSNLSCCGLDSILDWTGNHEGFIPESCCEEPKLGVNEEWSKSWGVSSDYTFNYCEENQAYQIGCLAAIKEHEFEKYSWVNELIIVMIVIMIGETVSSFLLFGLIRSDNDYDDSNGYPSMVGAIGLQTRTGQPTMISARSRPSVVSSSANAPSSRKPSIKSPSRAYLFDDDGLGGPIYAGPRPSISSAPKFSAAARRGSSFI